MDDVFGDGQRLAAADQARQDAIFRKLGLFNDTKTERKSDDESVSKEQ